MKANSSLKFAPAEPLARNLSFIDGITRSGKFWLANLLHHFDDVEHIRHDPTVDHVSVMYHLGMIREDAAVSLLQDIVNRHIYENAIGRNTNFRFADHSSVYHSPKLQDYLMRVAGPDVFPRQVFEELKRGGRHSMFIAHDWLSIPEVQIKAFPGMKLLRIERNPVDLVNAWYSTKIGLDRMFFSCRVKGSKGSVPWFAYEWRDEFDSMAEFDRIIRAILWLDDTARSAYDRLSAARGKRIFFTSYEAMAVRPLEEAEKIAAFLGTRTSDTLQAYVLQQPFRERTGDQIQKARKKKLKTIRENASKSWYDRLKQAGDSYEERRMECTTRT